MIKETKQAASVTAPLCIAITIMAVLILGLVEGARYYGLKEDAWDFTNLAAESLFAGYQPFLLEEYQMFLLDGSFGTGDLNIAAAEDEMKVLLYENLIAADNTGIDFYRMNAVDIEVDAYRLITDDSGKVFEAQAAAAMKEIIKKQAAEKIRDRIKGIKDKDVLEPEESIKNADKALEELKEQKEREAAEKKEEKQEEPEQPAEPVKENPMDTMKEIRKKGVLALVLPPDKNVSAKEVSVDHVLLKRNLRKGTYHAAKSTGWYERILMQEFIKQFAGNALKPAENSALSYGTEYLIGGRGSDEENLKKTVNMLLMLRESVNFLYLQTDKVKRAEALAAATAIAGVSANPLIISAVEQGILAAWAYVESICDVKALLGGGKVPLLKNTGNWKTQLSGLGQAVGMDYKGESKGLTYENYLDVFLYSKTTKQAAYRGMDLMEWNMQNEDGYEKCRMDYMITGLKLTGEYDADTFFFEIFGESAAFRYCFLEQTEYEYEGVSL